MNKIKLKGKQGRRENYMLRRRGEKVRGLGEEVRELKNEE